MKRRTKQLIIAGAMVLGLVALIVLLPAAVWRVIGWVFFALAVLIILLLLVPLTVSIKYAGGQLGIRVRVLFLPIKLWPLKLKPKKEKKPKKQKPKESAEEETQPQEKKKRGFGETWLFVKRIALAGIKAIRVFIRHVRVHNVQLVLPVHASEADATATNSARIQAIIGTVRALLDKRLHVSYKKLVVMPDFTGKLKDKRLIACKISFCLGIILVMGVVFLKKFMRKRAYNRKQYKQALNTKRTKSNIIEEI